MVYAAFVEHADKYVVSSGAGSSRVTVTSIAKAAESVVLRFFHLRTAAHHSAELAPGAYDRPAAG